MRTIRTARFGLGARLALSAACLLLAGLPAACDIASSPAGFSPTGSMSVSRMGHVAAGLRGGRVLVAGGYSAPEGQSLTLLASAEIYDPDAGGFSPTGSMQTARSAMTATLLDDGRVLVAGGYAMDAAGASVPLASAELYDPDAGTFTSTASLSVARYKHVAEVLASGRVLLAGGLRQAGGSNRSSLASAELFDAAGAGVDGAADMASARSDPVSIRLSNGRVLVAGGMAMSGGGGAVYLDSAELFDPDSGTWLAAGTMTAKRTGATATAISGGRVLIAGGGDDRETLSSAEIYQP